MLLGWDIFVSWSFLSDDDRRMMMSVTDSRKSNSIQLFWVENRKSRKVVVWHSIWSTYWNLEIFSKKKKQTQQIFSDKIFCYNYFILLFCMFSLKKKKLSAFLFLTFFWIQQQLPILYFSKTKIQNTIFFATQDELATKMSNVTSHVNFFCFSWFFCWRTFSTTCKHGDAFTFCTSFSTVSFFFQKKKKYIFHFHLHLPSFLTASFLLFFLFWNNHFLQKRTTNTHNHPQPI